MSSKLWQLIVFLSFLNVHSFAQIPIETSQEEEDDNVDNPLVNSNGNLVSLGNADTSMPYQYFINPINEVVVQENRLSIPFSQHNRNIDQSIIRTMPVKSVNELLTYVSGIDVRQRGPWGAQSDIGIDGGTFDQTLVLINGIKLTDPQTGHNMMNLPLPLDAIERVEILRGPAAAKYGVNALTGAINIVTKQAGFNGVAAHVYSGSSFNRDTADDKLYAGYGIQVGAHLRGENAQHLLSLSREATSGYRYNTAFQNSKVFYQNNIYLGRESNMQVLGGFVHNNFGANGFYAAPADIESKETVQTALAGINFNLHVNPNWVIKPRISYRYNHDDYIFVRQNPSLYRNRHETHIINTEFNNTFLTSIGDFGLGLEWRREEINSSNLGKWDRSNYGFYGEYSFNKVNRLLIITIVISDGKYSLLQI
jgi:vitamin B12 transporter